jgi:FtsH-binding integral membrane protein
MQVYTDAQVVQEQKRSAFLTNANSVYKVYLWFALGLLLTGGMAVGYPYLLAAFFSTPETFANAYYISLIVFFVLYLPLGIVVNIASLSPRSWIITTAYVLYSLTLGGLFSAIYLAIPSHYILYAFFISAGAFVLMGVLGVLTKGKIGKAMLFLIAAIFGLAIVSIFNLLLFRGDQYYGLYWAISVGCLLLFLIMAGVDVNRVMANAAAHAYDNNNTYVVYSAYCLYADFVIIFYYVLRIILLFAASSSRK